MQFILLFCTIMRKLALENQITMKQISYLLYSIIILFTLYSCNPNNNQCKNDDETADTVTIIEYGIPIEQYEMEEGIVKKGQTLSDLFASFGALPQITSQLNTLNDSIFNVKNVKAGSTYKVYFTNDSIRVPHYFVYNKSVVDHMVFHLIDSLHIHHYQKPINSILKTSSAVIESSLWNAIEEQNLNRALAIDLSDIYAWEIDFFGIQKGDNFTVLYDELFVDSTSIGIGKIHAVKFNHEGKDYYAYHYSDSIAELDGYWNEKGQNLKKAFLKAPLKFSRISSGFSYARKHPIYKIVRPHTGVDYSAPKGTPVMAIGDGKVIFKAYKGGGGNTIKIKHNSNYTTAYLHLSNYAKGIRTGSQVKQGQVIGYVGSTGASTGPHLDFRVWKNNTPINPLRMESPSADPIPSNCMNKFQAICDSLTKYLN